MKASTRMNTTRMHKTVARCAIALLVCGSLAPAAWGQVIFKSLTVDGTVEYSDAPPKGNKPLGRIEAPTPTPDQRRDAGSARETPQGAKAAAPDTAAEREAKLNAADAAVRSAQDELRAAEDALEKGREPLPGERRGTVSGHSRLSENYFNRLTQLETAVAAAKKRLEDAYSARRDAMY